MVSAATTPATQNIVMNGKNVRLRTTAHRNISEVQTYCSDGDLDYILVVGECRHISLTSGSRGTSTKSATAYDSGVAYVLFTYSTKEQVLDTTGKHTVRDGDEFIYQIKTHKSYTI